MENRVRSNTAWFQEAPLKSGHLSMRAREVLKDETVVLPVIPRVFHGITGEGEIMVSKMGPFPREFVAWPSGVGQDEVHEPISLVHTGCGFWIRGCEVTRHRSRICSIEMITAGDAWFIQEGKRYLLTPGQVFLLHPGLDHSYGVGPSGYLHKRYVNLGGKMLEPFLGSLGLRNCDLLSPMIPGEVKGLFRRIQKLTLDRSSRNRRKIGASLYELLLLLSESEETPWYPREFRRAMEHLEKGTHRKWNRAELCDVVGVSPTTLHRLFATHLQTTPLKHFMRLKTGEATTMLQSSNLSVKHIAETLGFPDPLYFSKVFSRNIGMSPTQFRRTQ